jgi:phage N-6-adenine-methyltransferase
MNTAVMFSSEKCEWATPQATFDALHAEFVFEVDVCALASNAKCEHYFTPEMDGLAQKWTGVCWMNPPYGREMPKWIRKAYESAQEGATVVSLLPARTDTAVWHDYCMKGEIRFIRGRLKFGGHTNAAPFPSAIVIFRPQTEVRESCI